MKLNKFTSALVALGIVSLAGVAQAVQSVDGAGNPIIYLTGSTAARAVIYAAATTANQIFTDGSAASVISTGANNTGNGANTIVYRGHISVNGVSTLVDLDCSFTGSEAGIAAVAGQPLTQDVDGAKGVALPGVPPSFLSPNNWTAGNAAAIPLSSFNAIYNPPANPDLAMADSSQTVSRTPKATYNLVDYGVVGVVPFSFIKEYQATHDTAWNHLLNVTTSAINQNLSAGATYQAHNYTGIAADTEAVVVCGRNFGSGTRVDTLLAAQYGITTPVDQFGYATYDGTHTLQVAVGDYSTSAQANFLEVADDGFDGGASVQKCMNVDGTGLGALVIGYLGVSDAQNTMKDAKSVAGHHATALSFNGAYESDLAVEQGTYTFWGLEHLLGSVGQVSTTAPGAMGVAIKAGIAAQLTSSGAGTATGDFSVEANALTQSVLIPTSLMQVHKNTDVGFPLQGGF